MYDPNKVRRLSKKNTAKAIFGSKIAQSVANAIIEVDDRIYSKILFLSNLEFVVTKDNFVSKTVRELFGIKHPLDVPNALRDKTAKSKWHEIVRRAESSSASLDAHARDRLRQEFGKDWGVEDSKSKKAPEKEASFDIYEHLERSKME